MRCRCLCAILLFCSAGSAQETTQPQLTVLKVTDSHALSTPAFMFFGPTQYDGEGNLYFRPIAASGRFNDSATILRINVKTETPTLYDLPSELATKVARMEYSVSTAGRVWQLFQEPGGDYVAIVFDSNGKMSSSIHLSTPAGFFANWFKVTDDSTVLVAGHFTEDAPKEMQGKPYLGIFDKNGNLRKVLGSPDLNSVDLAAAAQGPVEGDVAFGADGNFYFLQRDHILVISGYSLIVRQMMFTRPDNDALALRLKSADGFLSIGLVKIDKDRSTHSEFLVLYAANGAPYALYRGSDEPKGVPVCFLGRSGYFFSRSDHHRLVLLTEALR
jgi:hypothetical protein